MSVNTSVRVIAVFVFFRCLGSQGAVCGPHLFLDTPPRAQVSGLAKPIGLRDSLEGWAIGVIPASSDREESILVVDKRGDQHVVPLSVAEEKGQGPVTSLCSLGAYRTQARSCLAVTLWHYLAFYKANGYPGTRFTLDDDLLSVLDSHLGLEQSVSRALSNPSRNRLQMMLSEQRTDVRQLAQRAGLPLKETRSLPELKHALKNGHRAILSVEIDPRSGSNVFERPRYMSRYDPRRALRYAKIFATRLAAFANPPKAPASVQIWLDSFGGRNDEEVVRRENRIDLINEVLHGIYSMDPGKDRRTWTFSSLCEPNWIHPFSTGELQLYLKWLEGKYFLPTHSVLAHNLIQNGNEDIVFFTDYRKAPNGPKTFPVSLRELEGLAWSGLILDESVSR